MEILAANKKAKKVLITISGLDGSGKSTQAKFIKEHFANSKLIHIVDFRLVNRVLNFGKSKKSSNTQKKLSKNRIIGFVNMFLLLIDMFLFKVYFKIQKNNIICDRFFFDLIASHTYRYGDSVFLKFIIWCIPNTDFSFFLNVDENVAQKREQEGFHDIEYFQKMKLIYSKFYKKRTFIHIKNDFIEAVRQSIFNYLK